MAGKKTLEIRRLKKIDEILYDELFFLGYTSQKRNTAQLIQLKHLLHEIYLHYNMTDGLGTAYLGNVVKVNADIIKSVLYCSLRQTNIEIPEGEGKAMKLVDLAKARGLISKTTWKKARDIIGFRNNYHPDRQTELHSKTEKKVFIEVEHTVNDILRELYDYFIPKPEPEVCNVHQILLAEGAHGEPCPSCHELLI